MTTTTTDAARRLGIDHPIIQGPFGGGLSSPRLAALVSNRGGLGSYGAHTLTPDAIATVTAELRGLTARPFAMNLWVSDHDPGGDTVDAATFERLSRTFAPWFAELGLERPRPPERFHQRYADQVEALLEARPPVFSFVFGIPSPAVLAECRRRGIVTIGAATSVAEAQAIEASGADLVVASGFEAGGHRPAFLRRAEDSLMGTFALVQLAAPRVAIPVIAAGGIADARGVRAACALGAAAVQVGTAFLACAESGTSEQHRAALFSDAANDTALTRAFSGRLARGLRSPWIAAMESLPHGIAPFPVQSWFVGQLRAAALAAGRTDLVSLWSGQIAPQLRHRSAAAVMEELATGLAAA